MSGYILRRLLSSLLTALAVVTVAFVVLRLVPGDPAQVWLGEYSTPESLAEVRRVMGLDRPVSYQYLLYLSRLARGDLGTSYKSNRTVGSEIAGQYAYTITLTVASLAISALLGVPLGMWAAVRRGTAVDRCILVATVVWVASPVFWLGLILLFVLGMWLGIFPVTGAGAPGDVPSLAKHLVMPALTIGLRSSALVTRMTRMAVVEVLTEDYIRTARSKGLAERRVLWKHVFRNAATQVIGVLGIEATILMGGSVLVETIFSRPGVGRLLIDAVGSRDYAMVQGTLFFFIAVVILINLLTDVAYATVDPRVRFA